ncbi:DUF6079 family protein [Pontibacter lucknowensis]|uniref:Uncharacterized protein n=1 Tax=Pontibacter lucknowensis TaxID=1077936 RepID=A0A1N6TIJ4_9BACT|nr:DUF6079 family protein [Pontibacter lucknowensis]SIQ53199.1 hypothetical protein SAMN05421545_0352 [Pontibacter lucknowensis]
MKYKDLIQFEPINEVVKFSRTTEAAYQQSLIRSYVFSKALRDALLPLIVKNLDYNREGESFGIQVVGNYGTGKSHLMSLVSLIAENEQLLDLVNEEKSRQNLKAIAGKYKVLRFELGHQESLWDVVTYKLETFLEELGVVFSFDGHGPKSYFEKIQLMMAEFEEKYPDKGLLIVIDEMLSYLKGRSEPAKLNSDLQVLQALGQAADKSKFKIMFGVQEMIYHSPEFQFAADMLSRVKDRYKDITITKDDVSYVVKNRLLQKTEHQKQQIKDHLDPFLKFFSDMHGRTQDYIELFPVHPTYFENFERIRIGKSQREILKTLSNQFSELLEQDVPKDNPGLLTYDHYWKDLNSSQDLMAIPDVRKVKEVTDTVHDKIETHFTGVRASKKGIASRIANACAIKILQHDLNKQNGTTPEHLVDDLCLTDKLADDRDFLMDIMGAAAQQLITATSGQYFDKNPENGEYHLRIEGGVNFDQKIRDYAATMSDAQKDEYFFKFLEVNLPLHHDTYRNGFKIWEHSLDWKSHKTFREGYIFFGNPNEKSTTQPRQHFYMYFMPIFDDTKKQRNHEQDEVYFVMDGLSSEFREAVTQYGAALALEVRADTSQKPIYKQKIQELNKKARDLFEQEYLQVTKVDYRGKELPLNGYTLPGAGATKERIFSEVASVVLEQWFSEESPYYPKFSQLISPVAKENYLRLIKQALFKISNPEQANRDGEGILNGLGLYVPGGLDYSHSPYAKSVLKMLKDKGEGKVLNRDEILECIWLETNLWVSRDFRVEAELEFLVLATLAALGEIEINISSSKTINSGNLHELKNLVQEDFFAFTHIKEPKGLNEAALKEMFVGLLGKDLSKQLKDPNTYVQLVHAAKEWAERAVKAENKIKGGLHLKGVEIISDDEAAKMSRDFKAFSGFCDKVANYSTEAKMKNFQFSVDDIKRILEAKPLIEKVEKQLEELKQFETDIHYLQQCKQYVVDDALKSQISTAIAALGEKLASGNPATIAAYKNELEQLKTQYAEEYLKLYLKYRISDAEHTKKQALFDSDEKAICDILQEADFLSTAQYQGLIQRISKLKVADPTVNKATILEVPFHDFNPHEYVGQPVATVKELRAELELLLEEWETNLKDILEDPIVKKQHDLLDAPTAKMLNDFKTGNLKIDKQNALKIRNTISSLQKGLQKVELSTESLKNTFNKPLTPDEAIAAFKAYIDEVSKGKEWEKIRIVLK